MVAEPFASPWGETSLPAWWAAYVLARASNPTGTATANGRGVGALLLLARHASPLSLTEVDEEAAAVTWELDPAFEPIADHLRAWIPHPNAVHFASNDSGDPSQMLIASWEDDAEEATLTRLTVYRNEDPLVAKAGTVGSWTCSMVSLLLAPDERSVRTSLEEPILALLREAAGTRHAAGLAVPLTWSAQEAEGAGDASSATLVWDSSDEAIEAYLATVERDATDAAAVVRAAAFGALEALTIPAFKRGYPDNKDKAVTRWPAKLARRVTALIEQGLGDPDPDVVAACLCTIGWLDRKVDPKLSPIRRLFPDAIKRGQNASYDDRDHMISRLGSEVEDLAVCLGAYERKDAGTERTKAVRAIWEKFTPTFWGMSRISMCGTFLVGCRNGAKLNPWLENKLFEVLKSAATVDKEVLAGCRGILCARSREGRTFPAAFVETVRKAAEDDGLASVIHIHIAAHTIAGAEIAARRCFEVAADDKARCYALGYCFPSEGDDAAAWYRAFLEEATHHDSDVVQQKAKDLLHRIDHRP